MTLPEFFASNPTYLTVVVALLGLVVGSFLNVVILRLPVMLEREWMRDCHALLGTESEGESGDEDHFSLAFPASHCPSCKAPLKAWHNIPVISFLLLKGRCANCDAAIGWRYPAVEMTSALASAAIAAYSGWGWPLLAYLVFTWMLLTLAVIDIDTQLLPDNLTLPLLWAGLLFNLFVGPIPIADAVLGAAAGYLILWGVYWLFKLATGKEGMGYGDFKLLAALGAWLGWQSLPIIILVSSLVGAVLGVLILWLTKRGRSQPLPFGPYLAAAGWLSLLFGPALAEFIAP
ncbi:MAG: A24 family peptidase [Pseudomonadota bacterium]